MESLEECELLLTIIIIFKNMILMYKINKLQLMDYQQNLLFLNLNPYHFILNITYHSFAMSFFSKTEIKELKNNNQRIIRIAVSNVPVNPTIAITTSNKIHLFNQSGEKHQYELSRSITPTCIEWHPTSPILAIGWDNGRITIWNQDTKAPKQQGKPHSDPIMMIRFNPTGNRMVTSDLTGTIGVWRGINLLAVYQKQWAITHCVFSDIQLEGVKGNLGNLFLFAGRSGTVCLANDMNMCSDVCRVGGTIKALMFYQKEGSAIVITSNLLLVQFKINFTQKSVPQKKVKLSISGQPENLMSIWIGQSLLSTCSNQNMIRFWHLQADQNYVLTVFDVLSSQNNSGMNLGTDKISSIVYDSRGRSLVAGTRQGRLMFWKNMALGTDSPIDKDQWAPQQYINLNKQIQLLTVGKNNGVIVCKQNDGEVIIVSQTKISGKISGNYRALLKTSQTIQIIYDDNKTKMFQTFTVPGHVKGIDLLGDKILYWNNKSIQIAQIRKEERIYKQTLSKLDQKPLRCLFSSRDTFLISTDFGFNQMTLLGQVKQTLNFPQSQGKVLGLELLGHTLVLWTQSSYVRVFQIGNQIKQIGNSRRFQDSKGLIGNIRSCSLNATGKKIGIISNKQSTSGSSINHSFHIYDLQSDTFIGHDLGVQKIPISIFWDQKQPRYFGLQVQSTKTTISKQSQGKTDDSDRDDDANTDQQNQENEQKQKVTTRQFMTFFYTTETGIKYQDKYQLKHNVLDIFALKVPYFYSVERNKDDTNIKKTTLHDFQKINHQDQIIKNSILNFSFHLTSGNLDEAYKSVKNIQNSAIWQKMAIMCVKCKRLDVAQICIGNMKFARGARSIRQAKKQAQIQAQLGMVAIQLGMIQQAKKSYQQCGRYDLLAKVCQANGQIDDAIMISQKQDRINLKNAYYKAAKYYEASNKFQLAIQFYQRSQTHIKQVPRMLLQCGKIKELTDYVNSKKDKQLFTWLGQYNESIGNLQQAIKYYQEGDSTSNLVRLYLSQNQLQQSIKICNSESQPQACFLLARHLQKNNMLSEAIHFYAKAQYYSQAVKIAINNQLDGEIVSLSMAAPKEVAFRSASYFQRKGLIQKAIRLYKKAAYIKKANSLAQKHGFTQLISTEVPEQQSQGEEVVVSGDKATLTAKVNQLIEANKFERAVPLLVNLKQYEKALELCVQHNVPISQDLVKKMLPEQEPVTPMEKSKRTQLTKTIAEKCRKQGSFEIASNLYVKLGDKVKSLKCLIELGDAQKVILFANNARSAETWILAANFLQTADWHQNPDLMKNIILFYSKAKAYQNLSSFFQACSNVQIDQYRDYDKAVAALKQAIKHLSKATSPDRQAKLSNLSYKKGLIQKFIGLRQLAQQNPTQMINQCLQLLQEPDIEQTVRRGDIFAIVIQYYYQTQEYEKCFKFLKQMKERGIIITPYIDKQIIDGVYKALGISTKKKNQIQQQVIQDIS